MCVVLHCIIFELELQNTPHSLKLKPMKQRHKDSPVRHQKTSQFSKLRMPKNSMLRPSNLFGNEFVQLLELHVAAYHHLILISSSSYP